MYYCIFLIFKTKSQKIITKDKRMIIIQLKPRQEVKIWYEKYDTRNLENRESRKETLHKYYFPLDIKHQNNGTENKKIITYQTSHHKFPFSNKMIKIISHLYKTFNILTE